MLNESAGGWPPLRHSFVILSDKASSLAKKQRVEGPLPSRYVSQNRTSIVPQTPALDLSAAKFNLPNPSTYHGFLTTAPRAPNFQLKKVLMPRFGISVSAFLCSSSSRKQLRWSVSTIGLISLGLLCFAGG